MIDIIDFLIISWILLIFIAIPERRKNLLDIQRTHCIEESIDTTVQLIPVWLDLIWCFPVTFQSLKDKKYVHRPKLHNYITLIR